MREVALRDCGHWLSGGTPSTTNPTYWGGGIPWITAKSLKSSVLTKSERTLTKQGVADGSRLVPAGTLVFVVRGMSLNTEFRVGIAGRELAFGQDCKALIARDDIVPKYLFHALNALESEVLKRVEQASHGTGRLPTDALGNLTVRVPPIDEQGRITEVLDTVDEAIGAIQRERDKLALVRRGLARELLDSLSGYPRLPLERVCRGGAAGLVIGPFGSDLTATDYRRGGVPVYFVRDLAGTVVQHESGVFVTSAKAQQLRAHDVKAGDVLLTKMGAPPGEAAVFDGSTPDGIVTADVVRLRPNAEMASARFLTEVINGDDFRRQVAAITGGVTRPKITLRDLRLLGLPAVPAVLQQKVVAPLVSLDEALRACQMRATKLRQVRAGVAADLLCGRVRTVTV